MNLKKESNFVTIKPVKIGRFVGSIVIGKIPDGVFTLRYQTFVERLKWLPKNSSRKERDAHDELADILCVIDGNDQSVVGTVRIINHNHNFMLDDEFRFLVEGCEKYRKDTETAEISRLATRGLTISSRAQIMLIIFKLIKMWAKLNKVRYFYFVTMDKYANRLQKSYGFPMIPLGKTSFTDAGASFKRRR